MGFFDKKKESGNGFSPSFNLGEKDFSSQQKSGNVVIMQSSPSSIDDVQKLITALKAGKSIYANLSNLKPQTAQRVLDILSGAIYVLGGGIVDMKNKIYFLSPSAVEVESEN